MTEGIHERLRRLDGDEYNAIIKIEPQYAQISKAAHDAFLAVLHYSNGLTPNDKKVHAAFYRSSPPDNNSKHIIALCYETGQSFDDLKNRYKELEEQRLHLEREWKEKIAERKIARLNAKKVIFSGTDEAAKQLVREHYDAQLEDDISRARTHNLLPQENVFRKVLENDPEIEKIFKSIFDVIVRQAKELAFVTGEPLPEIMKERFIVAGFTEQKAAPYIRITEEYAKGIAAKAPKAETKPDPAPAAEDRPTGGERGRPTEGGHIRVFELPPEPMPPAPEPPREVAAESPPPPEVKPAGVEPPAHPEAASPPPPHEPVPPPQPPQGAAPEAQEAGEAAGASPSAKPDTGPQNAARRPMPQRVKREVTPTERSFVGELLHERPLLAGGAAVAAVAGLGYLALHDKRKEEEKKTPAKRQV